MIATDASRAGAAERGPTAEHDGSNGSCRNGAGGRVEGKRPSLAPDLAIAQGEETPRTPWGDPDLGA
jgi:hypothetical protein